MSFAKKVFFLFVLLKMHKIGINEKSIFSHYPLIQLVVRGLVFNIRLRSFCSVYGPNLGYSDSRLAQESKKVFPPG